MLERRAVWFGQLAGARARAGFPSVQVASFAFSIGEFLRDDDARSYVFDQSYQRGHVWTPERRRLLVKSLIMGLPLNAIYINIRDQSAGVYVVDGKQRITTLRMFVADEVRSRVPGCPRRYARRTASR